MAGLSINNSAPADVARRMLRKSDAFLQTAQRRITTGLRVSGPRDNAAIFAISVSMAARGAGLGSVATGLDLGLATTRVAERALGTVLDLLVEMKAKVVQYQDANIGVDGRSAIRDAVRALKNQIGTIIQSAEFAGVNLLKPKAFEVAAWTSADQDGHEKGAFAQRYDNSGATLGSEFQINSTTTNDQEKPVVATLSRGGFVTAWASKEQDGDEKGVYAQRYDVDGNTLGGEFQVNTTTADDQSNPSIAELAGLGFVVAWESKDQDGDKKGVFAQRYDVDGNTLGAEFRVNTTTTDDQEDPQVTELAEGGFAVTWSSTNQDGDEEGVFAQRFDSDGTALGSEFQVNTETTDEQEKPVIAALSGGGYVVSWSSKEQDGDEEGVYAQLYDADGNASGSELQVNSVTTDEQKEPSLTGLAGGGFVVLWDSANQDGSGKGVFGQRFDAAGAKTGAEFQVNTTTSDDQEKPSVAATADGGFVLTWESKEQDGDKKGVFARRFDSNGNAAGGEYQVNTFTTGDQKDPFIATGGTTNQIDSISALASLSGERISVANQYVTVRALGLDQMDLENNADAALATIEGALSYVGEKAAHLGGRMRAFEIQSTFTRSSQAILKESIGLMVDADISEEVAKVKAAEIRTNLSVQALNIANSSRATLGQLVTAAKDAAIG